MTCAAHPGNIRKTVFGFRRSGCYNSKRKRGQNRLAILSIAVVKRGAQPRRRCRFAEALFNHKAGAAHLAWRAASRGLALVPSQQGISPVAQRELLQRGVPQQLWQGAPKALTRQDLDRSDYIVLMEEAEHRPLLEKQFPKLAGQKVHYWHIADVGKLKPATACQAMACAVDELMGRLER